jgi:hypothetical protein
VILGIGIVHIAMRRTCAVAVWVIFLVVSANGATTAIARRRAIGVVGIVIAASTSGFVVIHVDGRICLFVMWCHRECGLIGVVVRPAELLAVVAWQCAMELVVVDCEKAEKGGSTPSETLK